MKTITVTELSQLEHPLVVDVREQFEYDEVHAAGVRLIPLMTIPEAVGELAQAAAPVYVICRSGARSARATEFLTESGVDAINVDGGMQAWVAAGLPTT